MKMRWIVLCASAGVLFIAGVVGLALDRTLAVSDLRTEVSTLKDSLADARADVSVLSLDRKSAVSDLGAVFEGAKPKKSPPLTVAVIETPSGPQELYVEEFAGQFGLNADQTEAFVKGLLNQGATLYVQRCYSTTSIDRKWSAGYCTREKLAVGVAGGGGGGGAPSGQLVG